MHLLLLWPTAPGFSSVGKAHLLQFKPVACTVQFTRWQQLLLSTALIQSRLLHPPLLSVKNAILVHGRASSSISGLSSHASLAHHNSCRSIGHKSQMHAQLMHKHVAANKHATCQPSNGCCSNSSIDTTCCTSTVTLLSSPTYRKMNAKFHQHCRCLPTIWHNTSACQHASRAYHATNVLYLSFRSSPHPQTALHLLPQAPAPSCKCAAWTSTRSNCCCSCSSC
jgi:hypothetical protein